MAVKNNSPWLADAADGATGYTYEIRAISDFMKVPESRRRCCLREFHAWMATIEGMTAVICAIGSSLKTPIHPDALNWQTDVFRWIDDGRSEISVQIHSGDTPIV